MGESRERFELVSAGFEMRVMGKCWEVSLTARFATTLPSRPVPHSDPQPTLPLSATSISKRSPHDRWSCKVKYCIPQRSWFNKDHVSCLSTYWWILIANPSLRCWKKLFVMDSEGWRSTSGEIASMASSTVSDTVSESSG